MQVKEYTESAIKVIVDGILNSTNDEQKLVNLKLQLIRELKVSAKNNVKIEN